MVECALRVRQEFIWKCVGRLATRRCIVWFAGCTVSTDPVGRAGTRSVIGILIMIAVAVGQSLRRGGRSRQSVSR